MNKLALLILACAVLELLSYALTFGRWSLFGDLTSDNAQSSAQETDQ